MMFDFYESRFVGTKQCTILKGALLLLVLVFNAVISNCEHQNEDFNKYARRRDILRSVNKCCDEGEGINRFIFSENDTATYNCTRPVIDNTVLSFNVSLKIPLVPLYISEKNFNVTYALIDSCDFGDPIEISLSSMSDTFGEYCVDKILGEQTGNSSIEAGDGSIVILTCESSTSSKITEPLNMKSISKCCTENMIYDMQSHRCVDDDDDNSSGLFHRFIKGAKDELFDLKYGLFCLDTKIIYEYDSLSYSFSLRGDILTLEKSKETIVLESGSYCLDEGRSGSLVARACRMDCLDGPCFTKCCPYGQVFMYPQNNCSLRPGCAYNPKWGFSPAYYDIADKTLPIPADQPATMGIRYTVSCPNNKYILDNNDPNDKYYLDVDSGHLLVPGLPSQLQPGYCVEMFDTPCTTLSMEIHAFVCFPEVEEAQSSKEKLKAFSYGLIVSCVFLAATLAVYIALPPLQNLHGRTIMCHVASMLVAYSCLARAQWGNMPHGTPCRILGYSIYFSFLAAFSWLNIMCFDIWRTFGNVRSIQGMKRNKDLKKFLMYSLYSWGFPLLLTTCTFLLDHHDVMRGILDPNIGSSQCWFNSDSQKVPVLVLFILPVGLQIASNVVMFTLTAIHCSKIKSEIYRMQAGSMGDRCKRRFTADKAKYAMNFKLFMVMGITWIWEILSSVYEYLDVWYVLDLINVFQGVPIFCILVMKKKVYYLIKKRLGLEKKKDRRKSEATMSTTANSGQDPLAKKSLLQSKVQTSNFSSPKKT